MPHACTPARARPWKAPTAARAATSAVGIALGQALQPADRLHELSAKTLGKLLAQPGALTEQQFSTALECALRLVPDMDGKDCIRVLRALAEAGGGQVAMPDDTTLGILGDRLTGRLSDISIVDMAELAENLASASMPALPIFSRLSIAFGHRCAGATATDLTKVATAFSQVRLADRRLFPRLAQSAMKQLHVFAAPELPAFLSSFAAVGLCHEGLLTGAAKVLVSKGPKMSALDLSLVAFAYAQFYLVFPGIVDMLRQRLPHCVGELPPVRLAELAVSCARLSVQEPALLATVADRIELHALSAPLFGQVARSLADLGLALTSGVQLKMSLESRLRLANLHPDTVGDWVLDVVYCCGATAQDARLNHGGVCPPFMFETLPRLAPGLAGLCHTIGARDLASLYRSLRQLPPSVGGAPTEGSALWPVHEAAADRAAALSAVDAYQWVELTSVAYSQMCLYPQLWAEEAHQDDFSATNPRWSRVARSWRALSDAWEATPTPTVIEDPVSQYQAAILTHLLPLLPNPRRPPADLTAGARQLSAPAQGRQSRPVANEITEILADMGLDARPCTWDGPVEVHAAFGQNRCFRLLGEDAFFHLPAHAAAFSEAEAEADSKEFTADGFEICFERAAEISLLQLRGWRVTLVSCHAWRRMAPAARRGLIEGLLRDVAEGLGTR